MASQDKQSSSREALLKAGERLFSERGYESVSTRDLAIAAGVNLGSIQYHFGSKAELFVATVHRMMEGRECGHSSAFSILDGEIHGKEDAAFRLCKFIHSFLDFILRAKGPQPCRIMFREVLSENAQDKEMFEALISSVTDNFFKPVDEAMLRVLRAIKPEDSTESLQRYISSIMGQCSTYVTHRPFLERLQGKDFGRSPTFDKLADHICRFSLLGLGLGEKLTESVLSKMEG